MEVVGNYSAPATAAATFVADTPQAGIHSLAHLWPWPLWPIRPIWIHLAHLCDFGAFGPTWVHWATLGQFCAVGAHSLGPWGTQSLIYVPRCQHLGQVVKHMNSLDKLEMGLGGSRLHRSNAVLTNARLDGNKHPG